MKKLFLIFLCVFLIISVTFAEEPSLPVFTKEYGFREYYSDLIMKHQETFQFWNTEDQAELSEMLPTLYAMETERRYQYYNGEHLDDTDLIVLSAHQYGIPGDGCISKEEATELARKWFIQRNPKFEEKPYPISACYIVENPENPQWMVSVYGPLMMRTHIDARTGEIAPSDSWEVAKIVAQYMKENIRNCYPPLTVGATYNFKERLWTLRYIDIPLETRYTMYYHEPEGTIIIGELTNGKVKHTPCRLI